MESSKGRNPVLLIGLDAAEPSLVDRWTEDGSMPTLGRLRRGGAFGRLQSTAEWLVGSPWPSFYTGTPPSDHGLYHYLLWRPEVMSTRRPSRDWLSVPDPFWRTLGEEGKRVVALDPPLTYAPDPFPGVEISGWATHELLVPPASYPEEIMNRVRDRFGSPPREEERYRLMTPRELLAIRDQLVSLTSRVGDLAASLAREEAWDLMLVCFSATHRGGHKLWSEDGVVGEPSEQERSALGGSLREVYMACDRAVGRILEAAGPDLTVLVFSLHGMGPNTCRSDILPELLKRVLSGGSGSTSLSVQRRLGARLRAAVPVRLRNEVKSRLPMALQDRLTAYWRTGGIDWNSTRAFAMASDLQGYIRINLRGREKEGIVEPGAEYDALCTQIIDGLGSFVDGDTGEPLVEEVGLASDLFPQGDRRDNLPDLVVRWNATPSSHHREIVSEHFGSIPWPTPGRHPSGRSGNHKTKGFLLAAGNSIPDGGIPGDAHILDLFPTTRGLLGLPPPPSSHGRDLFLTKEGA